MNPARLVFPGLRWRHSLRDRTVSELWDEVRDAIDRGVGGFVVFGGSAAAMRELDRRARDYAGRPILFAADLERGAGQQLEGATRLPPPAALAMAGGDAVKEAARITAGEAARAGIGWVLAPVADLDVEPANPIVGTRGFGADPATVAALVREWVSAVQREGVHACAKHFPGHGRTTADSHAELPVVGAHASDLQADLLPFRAAIEADVRSIMLAHVSFPALDPSGAPASLSQVTIEFLRNELGFKGLVVTDALMMGAVAASGRTQAEAVVEAVRAGCDALLYPESMERAVAALEAGLDSGELDEARVFEAAGRIESAAAEACISAEAQRRAEDETDRERASKLAIESLQLLRGSFPAWRPGQVVRLHVIDDDFASGSEFRAQAPESPVVDPDRLSEALRARGIRVLAGNAGDASESVDAELVAILSEVRAWKGRAGLAPESVQAAATIVERVPDAVLILFGHPRLAEQIPQAANIISAWCGEPQMQEAAAARLVSDGSA